MQEKLFYQFKSILKRILPSFLISWYHLKLALLAALIYRFPSRKLKVIGITGTNGKSTVVEMVSRIFEEAGFRVASLSSIRFRIAGKDEINERRMTLPGRFFVQKFLRRAVDSGCEYAILEITSEGIKQHRHRFINFETVVFTNLAPEHIESHGSFERYREAKGKLFKATKNIHILNLDDGNVDFFLRFPAKEKWGYTIENPKSPPPADQPQAGKFQTIKADNVEILTDGSKFVVNGLEFRLKLLGEFNVYNALAAICAARSQRISLEICRKALGKIESLPGRMEQIIFESFKVFVDYALTPNALEKVYQTLTTNYKLPESKLICVLGACGGGRDKWKRPVLGGIAAQFCDQIILTNEDPYDENPSQILAEIKSGISNFKFQPFDKLRVVPSNVEGQISNLYEIIDRREAINQALGLAKAGDTVIITGKGCEPSICLTNGQRIPWDDRQVVREAFEKLRLRKEGLRFEILPHTADVKIRAFGGNLEELFKNALLGMMEVMKPKLSGQSGKTRRIELKSIDRNALFIDFLNEVLYLAQANKEAFPKIKFSKFSDTELEAELVGQKVESFSEDIKAVTYHGAEIKQKNDGTWETAILFDI
jgi:UDP-N-acetylmuramoyl-L-alanyl-D-glutamate--2,6-diaminopimelate ligase